MKNCQGFKVAPFGDKVPCGQDLTQPIVALRIPYVANPAEVDKENEPVAPRVEFLSLCMDCAGRMYRELTRWIPSA